MIIHADARAIPLRPESVQCVVTSPPYWGLRDYGMSGQLGVEATPSDYVASMVAVFREVWRVLKSNGTCWLNLGDSYAAHGSGAAGKELLYNPRAGLRQARTAAPGLKPKDLVGIPWRVALALQADGWYLRQDIIWAKPNPMPESVLDRCTKSHEYLFLLTKHSRYYWDVAAMQEPGVVAAGTRGAKGSQLRAAQIGVNARPPEYKVYTGLRNRRSVWTIQTRSYAGAHFATMPPALVEPCIRAGTRLGDIVFDPFLGSGTVLMVANTLGRRGVGTELNVAYHALACQRLEELD